MGTKTAIADRIAQAFGKNKKGSILELFAGMSAIGNAIAGRRAIWTNDTQAFSRLACEFQFIQPDFHVEERLVRELIRRISEKKIGLIERYYSLVHKESFLIKNDHKSLGEFESRIRKVSLCTKEHGAEDYNLFSKNYPGTYFSLSQCIEIDAIRYAVDLVAPAADPTAMPYRRWMLTALGAAISRCSNSTGHFAQHLVISESNFTRVLSKRKRSIVWVWLSKLQTIRPVGSLEWRQNNKVFGKDAIDLLDSLSLENIRPDVVYADPPYTSDQYSRYYHILDTMVLYDYPQLSGKGRYRQGRFQSDWSLKSKVRTCFVTLAERSARLGSSLVVSYPDNGLLEKSEAEIPAILRASFKKVQTLPHIPHMHSTMGASKGQQKHPVVEQIFVASNS